MKKSKLWIATICFIVAGVVLIGVAALVGGRDIFTKYPIFAVPFRTTLVTDVNEQSELIEEPFEQIEIELNISGVEIEVGNVDLPTLTYSEYRNGDELLYEIRSEVKDGTLKITDYFARKGILNGVLPANYKPMVLLLPKEQEIKNMTVKLAMGSLDLTDIVAGELDVTLDMGGSTFVNVTSEHADIELSMGSLELKGGNIMSGKYNLSMGSIESTAKLTGNQEITCNMGSVELNLPFAKSEISYDADIDMGSLIVNGKDTKQNHHTAVEEIANINIKTDMGI